MFADVCRRAMARPNTGVSVMDVPKGASRREGNAAESRRHQRRARRERRRRASLRHDLSRPAATGVAAAARTHSTLRSLSVPFEKLEPRHLLATVMWDGGGDGIRWHDAENWTNDTIPAVIDDVVIRPAEDSLAITVDDDVAVASIDAAATQFLILSNVNINDELRLTADTSIEAVGGEASLHADGGRDGRRGESSRD